ncbi:MAG: hypothetical protein KA474_09570 [Acinetobacter sp.]|nr:hypothetical protein [Acinetobacter sp.]
MKKYFAIFSFLILSSTVFANTVGGSIGGWQVVSNVANGIGAKITATKDVLVNGAKTTVTGTANIMPNPSNMGKFMARLGGAAVVSEALNQLLDGVDYVMDPANNTITYKDKNAQVDSQYSSNFIYYGDGGTFYSLSDYGRNVFAQTVASNSGYSGAVFSSASKHPNFSCDYVGVNKCVVSVKYTRNGASYTTNYTLSIKANPAYNPNADVERKSKPLSDVASQVLDQAQEDIKAGNVASPAVTLSRAVAQDMVQEAEADDVKARPIAQELEKNPEYPSNADAEGEITKPEVIDPATGEVVKPAETSSIAMKFPKACEWFPQLCLFIDWMQKPQELDEPDLPTKEIEKKEIDEELIKISSSSCPAPIDVNIPLPVFNTTYTDSISVSEYCPKIEKLAPVLQLLAFVLAIMIIKDI